MEKYRTKSSKSEYNLLGPPDIGPSPTGTPVPTPSATPGPLDDIPAQTIPQPTILVNHNSHNHPHHNHHPHHQRMVLPHHMNLIPPPHHASYPSHHLHHPSHHHPHQHPHHHHHISGGPHANHSQHSVVPPPMGSYGGISGSGGPLGLSPHLINSSSHQVVSPIQCNPSGQMTTGAGSPYDDVFLRPMTLPPWDDFAIKMEGVGGNSGSNESSFGDSYNSANSMGASILEEVVPQQQQHSAQNHFGAAPYMVPSGPAGVMDSSTTQQHHHHQYRYPNLKMGYNNSVTPQQQQRTSSPFTVPTHSPQGGGGSGSSAETGTQPNL